MYRSLSKSLLILALAMLLFDSQAGALQLTPVTIDVVAPQASATIQLYNPRKQPADVQLRVFQWRQVDGEDHLVDSRDVIVSPPFAKLTPGGDQVIRIVRVTKKPVRGEESYRLIVDELPHVRKGNSSGVNFALRYSIPVFFNEPDARPGRLEWSADKTTESVRLTARNSGDRRVRVSALGAHRQDGRGGLMGNGLAGYVLGSSWKTWTAPATIGKASSGTVLTITAREDNEPERRGSRVLVAD